MLTNDIKQVIYDGSKDTRYVNNVVIYNDSYSFICNTCVQVHMNNTYKIIEVYDLGQSIIVVRSEDVVFLSKINKQHSSRFADKIIGIIMYNDEAYIWRIFEGELSVLILNVINFHFVIDTWVNIYTDNGADTALMLFMKYYASKHTDLTKLSFGINVIDIKNKVGVKYVADYKDIIFVFQ